MPPQEGRGLVTNTLVYFAGCLISFAVIFALNSFVRGQLDSLFFRAAAPYFLFVMLPAIAFGFFIATVQNEKKYLLFAYLTAGILLIAAGITIVSFTCKGFECVILGVPLIIYLLLIVPYAALIPAVYSRIPIVIFPIVVLLTSSILWVIPSSRLIFGFAERKVEQQQDQEVLKEADMPIFDTNYKELANKILITETVTDLRNPDANKSGIKWLKNSGGYLVHGRYYKTKTESFFLDFYQYKPAGIFTDQQMYKNDLAELREQEAKYNSQTKDNIWLIKIEPTIINGFPAIIKTQTSSDPELRVYRQGIIILLEPHLGAIKKPGYFQVDELIKIGESLEKTTL